MATASVQTVGQRVKRQDSPPKLTGQERFAGDLRLPGQVYARLVGSPYAHGTLKGIDASAALAMPGVVAVLTADDLPVHAGENPLAKDEVLYAGQPVAVVLAETEAIAEDAVLAVEVDIDPLDVVYSIDQALDPNAPPARLSQAVVDDAEAKLHNADAATGEAEPEERPANVSNTIHYSRGDIQAGFADADEIVELTFTSAGVHQGYIEPQVALAAPDALGGMAVYTSTQGLFHVRNKVAEALGADLDKVVVTPMPVGGGFGGKFGLIEPLVALCAAAAQRPVLLQYTRMEDFLTANPAPECRISVKLGATKDGYLTALQGDLTFLTGAFPGSPLQIAAILLGGYYRVANLEITGQELLSNRSKTGAYRAPGAQQASFAIEASVDELARKLGMDPLEFRLKNCVVEGDPRPNGAAWPRIGLKETLEAIREHPLWQNREQSRANGRGVGLAIGGWPGGLEPATAICRLDADGKLTLVLGSVDLNGTNTAFAQMVAQELNLPTDSLRVTTANTAAAPFAGGTGGSKITYTVGAAVKQAAEETRKQILNIAAQHLEAAVEDLELVDGKVQVKGVPSASISLKEIADMSLTVAGKYEPVLGRGASAITNAAPGFAVHLAEVSVDEVTGEVTVHRYVAGQDVGFAINPALVEQQIHGGVAQGIGWALFEAMKYDEDGQLQTASFMDYTLPRAHMIPEIETVLVEVPSEHGPYGAKGVGEPPAVPGPAAITNAIRDAVGVRVTQIPVTPEVMLNALSVPAAAD